MWVSHTNAQYNTNSVSWGLSWDTSGGSHPDPSSGSDPYVALWAEDTSNVFYNEVTWNNLSLVTPQDPMPFFWNASQ